MFSCAFLYSSCARGREQPSTKAPKCLQGAAELCRCLGLDVQGWWNSPGSVPRLPMTSQRCLPRAGPGEWPSTELWDVGTLAAFKKWGNESWKSEKLIYALVNLGAVSIAEIQRVRALWGSGELSHTGPEHSGVCAHLAFVTCVEFTGTFSPSKGSNCTKPPSLSLKEHCWPLQSPVPSLCLYMGIPKGASSIPTRKSLPLPLWHSFPSFFTVCTFGLFWAIITFSRSLFLIFLPEKPSPFNKKYNTKAFWYGQEAWAFFYSSFLF